MAESDAGKLASPTRSDKDATQCSADDVAQCLLQVEALVGVAPHTVDAVSVIGPSRAFYICDLQIPRDGELENMSSFL